MSELCMNTEAEIKSDIEPDTLIKGTLFMLETAELC